MKYVLAGRVVSMVEEPLARGKIYIDGNTIVEVQPADAPAPHGFEKAPVLQTSGTIYPGLIELHNHLPYNVLPLWRVPKKFGNRDQWSGTASYRENVTGPMQILGVMPGLLPAVVRYVECKCLLGGVTTTQGVALFSNSGARRYYRGLVRNVEQTDAADLPEAATRIADVDKTDTAKFLARLQKQSCMLLHLSEGTDASAHRHFESLKAPDGSWAITKALAGIHSVALSKSDFGAMAARKGAMVWSPLSNLLLYGGTAKFADAHAEGVRIGLGSDWSYSGSKNLLGELKIARVLNQLANGPLSDRDLLKMVTTNAASILQWERVLGSIEKGKRADLLVIAGTKGDAYEAIFNATERSIALVIIDGEPRFGRPALMTKLGAKTENVRVDGVARAVALRAPEADPAVEALTLAQAIETVSDALSELPALAKKMESRQFAPIGRFDGPPRWFLALDEISETGMDVRPRLPMPGTSHPSGPARALAPAKPLSELVKPIALGKLTAAEDDGFRRLLQEQPNIPEKVRAELKKTPLAP